MTNVVNALKDELTQLEDELKHDPRLLKIQKIKDLLAVYGAMPATENIDRRPQAPEPVPQFVIPPSPDEAKAPSKKDRVRAEISALMEARGLVHRNIILDHLTKIGLMGHEKDPMASLASYLSESKDIFAFDGKGHWFLRAAHHGGTPRHEGELPLANGGHV